MKQMSNKMKNTRIIRLRLLLLLIFVPIWAVAQTITITGNVKDKEGEPIIGASIVEKGGQKGTITDFEGNFSLTTSPKTKQLIISFMGMKTKEVAITAGRQINVVLEDDAQVLEDVVIIGYGSVKRSDLTGSVSSVGEKALKDIPVTSAASAITGRLAGVNVVTTEGSPDAAVKITVRGGGSITQDNSPLYIVDGFQVNDIGDIPPGDIETIDVLKDAASTAIYGAKGANGVILITTKGGKEGKTEIKLNASVGFSDVYNLYDVLSPYDYVYYQRELDPSVNAGFLSRYGRWEDVDIYKTKQGTDWQDKLYGNTGIKQNYNLSVRGGDKSFKYSLSYTHDDETYIMKTSEFKRDNLNLKISKEINKKLSFDFGMKLAKTVVEGASVSDGKKLRNTVKYAPVPTLEALSEEDLGNEGYNVENLSSLNDPFYSIVNEYKQQNKFSNRYNAALTWKIIKGLSFKTEGTYEYLYNDTDNIWLNNTGEANSNAGQPVAQRQYWKGINYSVNATLNYQKKINKHNFGAVIGTELTHKAKDEMKIYSKYFPKDFTTNEILAMWNYGKEQPTYTKIEEPSRTSSYFGRFNYDYNNRYYLTLTCRRDGINVFAPGHKWGTFPSVAAAWRISDEDFMANTEDWLSNLKLRLSYGLAGNARLNGSYWRQDFSPENAAKNLYYPNETSEAALKPTNTLRNEKLSWETKYSANAGLDVGLWGNRVNLTLDVYQDITKDLLLQIDLPSHSGYAHQYQNLGKTTNRGLELTLNGVMVETKDWHVSANVNISFNKNKVNKLDDRDFMIVSSGRGADIGTDDYRVFVGQELGLIYGYVVDGMYTFDDFNYNSETKKWDLKEGVANSSTVITTSGSYFGPGHIKLKKLGGEGVDIDPDVDRKVIGNALPKHTGGFSLNAGWKGFDLAAMFNWSYGNDIFNANKIDYTTYSGSKRYQNISTIMSIDKRFTTIDPATGLNIYYGNYADPERLMELNQNASIWHPLQNQSIITDWAIEDGSFLRFSNLTIVYTLPKQFTRKFGVQNLRVYATANNLYCWTAYSGQDPEVSTKSGNLSPGVDYSAYPKAHSYIFGLNVTF